MAASLSLSHGGDAESTWDGFCCLRLSGNQIVIPFSLLHKTILDACKSGRTAHEPHSQSADCSLKAIMPRRRADSGASTAASTTDQREQVDHPSTPYITDDAC